MSARLHVRNLPATMDSIELGRLFETYGTVRNVEIISQDNTHQSKGFGFVEMNSDDEAARVVTALDGTECLGQILSVQQVGSIDFGEEESDLPGPSPGGFGDRSGKGSTWGRPS